jgi:hypothetical protein
VQPIPVCNNKTMNQSQYNDDEIYEVEAEVEDADETIDPSENLILFESQENTWNPNTGQTFHHVEFQSRGCGCPGCVTCGCFTIMFFLFLLLSWLF